MKKLRKTNRHSHGFLDAVEATNPGTRGAQEILKGQRVHLLATSTYHGECFFLRGKNTSLKNLSLEILKGQRVHMLFTVSCVLVPGAHSQKK